MIVKTIVDEDFSNYKKPSMFIASYKCSGKCEKECGMRVCQNSTLATAPNIKISTRDIIERYLKNPLTEAIVFGGLEPFDDFDSVAWLIKVLRLNYMCDDVVVIYTGYYLEEIQDKIDILKQFKNIIIKFGRFIPNNKGKFDKVLGVRLASDNQYAKQIS
ncbi:MAG: 4Fe-4S cluster-binding domain-containing protein [Clostridia bacterium]|nr:4Fe-4S cluster-binding domain-containing protein [Clostridia bacterium]